MGEHEHRRPVPSQAPVGAAAHVRPTFAASILRFQRDAGNGAVVSVLARSGDPARSANPSSVLQRSPLTGLTRAYHIAALKVELANAEVDPSRWSDVVRRLNEVDPDDLPAVCASIPNKRLQAARSAVDRISSPSRQAILAALEARARKSGVKVRPFGGSIWAMYQAVSYGTLEAPKVWEHIGGSVGKTFSSGNTCAARVSWALNYGGHPVSGDRGSVNDQNTEYKGNKGDGMRYIVWVPTLQQYLTNTWGKPDKVLLSKQAAITFEASLRPNEAAVFAGPKHAGMIKTGYNDPYVKSDPGVMPVSAWRLAM